MEKGLNFDGLKKYFVSITPARFGYDWEVSHTSGVYRDSPGDMDWMKTTEGSFWAPTRKAAIRRANRRVTRYKASDYRESLTVECEV